MERASFETQETQGSTFTVEEDQTGERKQDAPPLIKIQRKQTGNIVATS